MRALLACQRDATLRVLDTEVLGCEPSVASAGTHRVRLADTVLYPEGGGQPADHGTIGDVQVEDVQRADDVVWHHTTGPVPLGPTRVEVDWARRWDHMQQHSGQHLLTAVCHDRLGRETRAFHLGREFCTIDLTGPPLSTDEMAHLEELVNDEVIAARAVRPKEVGQGQLEALGVRTRGLPDHIDGPVRLVEIDGLDLNTCGGTHVSNTAALQVLHLVRCDSYKGGCRLTFMVGGRALRALRTLRQREQALTSLLRQGPEAHVEEVQRILNERKQSGKARKAILSRLASLEGATLVSRPGDPLWHHGEAADLAYLGQLARAWDPTDRVLVLTGGPMGDKGVFLVVGPAERVATLGPRVAAALDGRGGGRKGRFQGQAGCLRPLDGQLG